MPSWHNGWNALLKMLRAHTCWGIQCISAKPWIVIFVDIQRTLNREERKGSTVHFLKFSLSAAHFFWDTHFIRYNLLLDAAHKQRNTLNTQNCMNGMPNGSSNYSQCEPTDKNSHSCKHFQTALKQHSAWTSTESFTGVQIFQTFKWIVPFDLVLKSNSRSQMWIPFEEFAHIFLFWQFALLL